MQEAYQQGVLSINHRSAEFVDISKRTVALIKEKLGVPADYTVFYVSSATECWEIISQSLVRHVSYHVHNGAFGQKWFRYAQQLQPRAEQYAFNFQQALRASQLEPSPETEIICLTHNETSNGTALPAATLADIRTRFPEPLIAVDATSSLAGVELPIALADVWYASVQKCFGLPAGMAVLICSPRALEKAQRIGENRHYNSLQYMAEQMQRWQTTHTPNVLGIYLLMRTLEDREKIKAVDEQIQQRYQAWVSILPEVDKVNLLVNDPALRSRTVVPLVAEPATITQLREQARRAGIVLGNGYGDLKPTTLRIANFPAIPDQEIEQLKNFLQNF